jgi:hypothetical protein
MFRSPKTAPVLGELGSDAADHGDPFPITR